MSKNKFNNKKPYDSKTGKHFEKFEDAKTGKRNKRPARNSDAGSFPPASRQDPYWYAHDDATIKNFASLPFVNVSGDGIPGFSGNVRNPGIMVIPYTPTMPGCDVEEASNFATRAADAYYQSIAQGFSANFNFEAPDLLMLEVAAAGLYAFLAEGARAIGCMSRYLQNNAYWAKGIVKALGFNYDDLKANRKEFVSQYNMRVEVINKTIALPKSFFIGERWRYLSSSLFTESEPIDYSCIFAYKMAKIPTYNATALSTGTSITWQTPGMSTMSAFFDTVDDLIAYLTGSDQREMFGAIRRVYSEGELLTLSNITTDFVTSIENNVVQSAQLHNAITFQTASIVGKSDVSLDYDEGLTDVMCYQDAFGRILGNYYAAVNGTGIGKLVNCNEMILSLCELQNTAATVLDITANIPAVENKYVLTDSKGTIGAKIFPRTEILGGPVLWLMSGESFVSLVLPQFVGSTASISGNVRNAISFMSRIRRAPFIYMTLIGTDSSTDPVDKVDFVGELNMYTTVSKNYLRDLHNKCAYQLLALPLASKSTTR